MNDIKGEKFASHKVVMNWICICLMVVTRAGGHLCHPVSIAYAAGPAHPAGRITIMSYNIRMGYGAKDRGVDPFTLAEREENLPPIVAAIRSINPDVVGLQEVRGRGQVKRLSKILDMHFAYVGHPTGSAHPSWWGVAVLSKHPILKTQNVQISSGKGNSKRALICTLDFGGQRMVIGSIHKDRDLIDGASFRAILKAIEAVSEPIVLVGDLNMLPSDRRLRLLQPRFIDTARAAKTASAAWARKAGTFLGVGRIDYVLAEHRFFDVHDAGLISSDHWAASDHIGYYAKIALKR